jgi:hypothetical protein
MKPPSPITAKQGALKMKMNKVIYVSILALLLPVSLYAQTQKVIVLEPYGSASTEQTSIIQRSLVDALNKTGVYEAITGDDTDRLIKTSGAKLLCVTHFAVEGGFFLVESYIMDLENQETEIFEKTAVQLMAGDPAGVEKGCLLLASKLAGKSTPDGIEVAFGGGTGSDTYKEMYDRFTLGLRAGYNMMTVSSYSSSGDFQSSPLFGLHLGLVGDHAVRANFAIQWGLIFAWEVCTYEYSKLITSRYYSASEYKESGEFSVGSFQIPINFQWKPDLGSAKFLLQAGPYFSYAIFFGGTNGEWIVTNSYGSTFWDDCTNDTFMAFEFGLGLGTGFQFGKFQIGVGYNIGINKVNYNAQFPSGTGVSYVRNEEVSWKNNAFVITTTILFK